MELTDTHVRRQTIRLMLYQSMMPQSPREESIVEWVASNLYRTERIKLYYIEGYLVLYDGEWIISIVKFLPNASIWDGYRLVKSLGWNLRRHPDDKRRRWS